MTPAFLVAALRLAGLLAAGAASGVIGSLLGLGGGIFLIPALVLVFGVPMHQAVAASLVAIIATSCAGASRNAQAGLANVRLGTALETTTVLGALAGALLAHRLPERALLGLFAALLFAVCAVLWRRGSRAGEPAPAPVGGLLDGEYEDPASGRAVRYSVRHLPGALAASLGAGFMSALLGVGGGIVKVPAMHLFCGVPMKAAAATSNFMIGVTASASAVVYLCAGHVPALIAATVALGVLAGSQGGLWLSRRLSDAQVRRVFAAATFCIAWLFVRRVLAP